MPQRVNFAPPCHCLTIRQAARQVTQLYDRHLASTGLRSTQYSVLRVLSVHAPVTVQGLAERMVMDRTTLSRALRPLQREGLVTMEPGSDARTRVLALTAAGDDLLERMTLAWDRAQAEFETRYGADETGVLRGMLSRVVAQMA